VKSLAAASWKRRFDVPKHVVRRERVEETWQPEQVRHRREHLVEVLKHDGLGDPLPAAVVPMATPLIMMRTPVAAVAETPAPVE